MFKLSKRRINEFGKIRKSLDISLDEYTRYYELLTNVNKKTARLRKNANALYSPKYSTKSPGILFSNKAEFNKRIETFEYILTRGFRREINTQMREQFLSNLENLIGGGRGSYAVLDTFRNMSDKSLVSFTKNNPDLGALAYGSGEYVERFLDENVESMQSRLQEGDYD